MFQLIHLRCFVTLATELHFGRAAARLNISQPPLTRHIQQLEHELGVSLFDRDRRSVRLTASGKAFLPEAEDILRRVRNAEVTARRAQGQETGRVTFGFIPVACYSLLSNVVALARDELPGIELELKEMTTADQVEALMFGRIDMGLVRPVGIERPGVVNSCILREDYVLALPSEHPLARKRKVGIHDLNDEDFVMYSPTEGRYGFEILVSAFRAATVEPRFVQYVTHTHSILALVNSGMGLALVPASASNVQFGSLVFKAIDLGPQVFAELFLSTQEKNANPAADLLLAKLQRLLVR